MITIVLGWWLAPTIITILCLFWAAWANRDTTGGMYGAGHLVGAIYWGFAIIVSLAAWLIYAFAT